MDSNDYSGWTPRRPGAGFACRTVDAMLAPADAEVSGEVAVAPVLQLPTREPPLPRRATKKSRFGAFALLLAAALVATTAVGMYRAQRLSLPVVEPGLPAIAVPEPRVEPAAVAAKPPPPVEPVQAAPAPPAPLKVKPRPSATAKPPPAKTSIPRCDCLGDVSVCGCIEPAN
jgi:hypothetical protein